MAYLVRKLIKRDRLSALEDSENIGDILADIPTTEFRTTNGALSTWKIESIGDLDEAVLAIAVSSTEISKMDFIAMDTDMVKKYDLSYNYTYAGMDIPVPDLQNKHCDILDITMDKLNNCACLYREILNNEPEEGKFIVRYTAGEIKELLKNAVKNNRVDREKAFGKIAEVIDKISA